MQNCMELFVNCSKTVYDV